MHGRSLRALQTSMAKFLLFAFALTPKTACMNREQLQGELVYTRHLFLLQTLAALIPDEIAAQCGATRNLGGALPEIQGQARGSGRDRIHQKGGYSLLRS